MADLRSKSYIKVLDLISEGEIVGLVDGAKSVFLNETPLQNENGEPNFGEFNFDSRTGTNAQTLIKGFSAVENEISVGVEVTQSVPVTRTVTNADVDSVRVKIRLPGLFNLGSDGNPNGWQVRVSIDIKASSDPSFVNKIDDIISGKSMNAYERDYIIELSGSAPWQIRVNRVTADNTDPGIQNDTIFSSYTEIISAKLRYPNSALVALRFDSEQFGNLPRRAYDVKLLKIKIPSNYNPETRTYTGVWDGNFKPAKEWTDNPAWVFYDLITNPRYGLGGYIPESQVDKWALYTVSQYCDQMVSDGLGNIEPRFTCNLYIQSREEAYKVIQDLASVFRGMVYWASGALTVSQDAPSDPAALYTLSNVIDGEFSYSGTAAKARHTIALVAWNDPSDFYRQKIEYVEDPEAIARFGVIQTEVAAIGCTSRGQANRLGRWLLYSEQNETETVTFRTGIEGVLARPGQVIKVADPSRAGARFGGRVSSATTTAITVDASVAVTLPAEMSVLLPDGTVEVRSISSLVDRVVTVSPAFTLAPQVAAQWIISSTTVEAQTFRVISMQESGEGVVEITGLKHDPAKYDAIELGLELPPRDFTQISLTPPPPSGLTVVESLYKYQSSVFVLISLGWDKATGAQSYRVDYRFENGNFKRDTVSVSDWELRDANPGNYTFRVYSIGPTGIVSKKYTELSATIFGKTLPPANVGGFAAEVDPNAGIILTWSPVADLDLQGYRIRRGATWDTAAAVATVSGTSFLITELPTANTTYLIKALDTTGNLSQSAASVLVTLGSATAPVVSVSFAGELAVLNWTASTGSFAIEEYEIRYGNTYAGATIVGRVKATTFSTKAAWSGLRRFWVTAVEISGRFGTPASVDAIVVVPSAVTIAQEVIDNNVLLRWGDAKQTLEIDSYELRRGTTFAGATVIGKVSARFSAIFETAGGVYTYWIVGIDLAGNYGVESSTTVQVSQPPDYVLQFNQDSTFSGTRTNIAVDSEGTRVVPFSTTETFENHFISRGWTTPQNQIDAGFPYYVQPSLTSGAYEEIIDYGTVIGSTKITATLDSTLVTGAVTITPRVSVRLLVTDPWTDFVGQDTAFATNFRYVKIRYDFTASGGNDLLRLNGLNVRFDVKFKNDSGTGAAVAGDVGGTVVPFNVSFVDVSSISVTPLSTTPVIAVYDFVDTPNPTSFKVLLFNTAGTRVSGSFSWTAKGV